MFLVVLEAIALEPVLVLEAIASRTAGRTACWKIRGDLIAASVFGRYEFGEPRSSFGAC